MSFVKTLRGKFFYSLLLNVSVLLLCGCYNEPSKIIQETPTSGTINISVDESFKPIIDSQIKVFESSFPDAHIKVHYKAEADCLRDLASDSTRMIIVTRGLNKQEENFYEDSIHYIPVWGVLAFDAIAVIVNNQAKDSIFNMSDLSSILSGSSKEPWQVVMDGVSATSTVRFLIDSVLRGHAIGKNVSAARSSEQVIDFVANNPSAIGFIGVSWIGDQDDPHQVSFLRKVHVAAVNCRTCGGATYVKPYQGNIALNKYPMVRGLYYILKENFSGIGNNFVNFLQYERGQMIFKRAYLWPARMTFEIRDVQMN